ncbi:MAG: copper resistance protein CopC [Nitrospiria bacterium]
MSNHKGWSHSFSDHSEPKAGWKLKTSSTEVKIWIDVPIELLVSKIEVFVSNRNKLDKGDSHMDPNNQALLIVSISSLSQGKNEFHWSVISADCHSESSLN